MGFAANARGLGGPNRVPHPNQVVYYYWHVTVTALRYLAISLIYTLDVLTWEVGADRDRCCRPIVTTVSPAECLGRRPGC